MGLCFYGGTTYTNCVFTWSLPLVKVRSNQTSFFPYNTYILSSVIIEYMCQKEPSRWC